MTIKITIDTGNAAFEEPNKEAEIERILRAWLGDGIEKGTRRIHDYNGNAVGTITVTGK